MTKWIVFLAVVAGSLFFAYRTYDASVAPVGHYKKFAEELLHGHYDVAAALCDGISKEDLEQQSTMEKLGGAGAFQTLFNSRFTIESRETQPDGAVALKAIQLVLWNPPGVESALRPAMVARMNQSVTLRKTGGDWKVVEFDNKFDHMEEFKPR